MGQVVLSRVLVKGIVSSSNPLSYLAFLFQYPISSVPSERIFYFKRIVRNKRRALLTHETTETLLNLSNFLSS